VRAPTLAAITLNETGGGIAVVSDLLARVFQKQWGPRARLLTMFDHENRPATRVEKAWFTLSLAHAELFGHTDWVLFSHLGLARIQRAIPARLRRPYGVFLHGIEAWKPLNRAERQTLAEASVRIANSRYTARRVMALHPDIGHIEACPLALPPASGNGRNNGVAAVSRPIGPHAILVVGRMSQSERYKGHDQLIDAWPAVVARVPDAQLVIVGEGDDAPRLRLKAAQTPCGDRIAFTGFVPGPTLETLYGQAALFALPSGGEGFGLVYLEAMTHRLACVGSMHDAASEIIVDGVTGMLVDQTNIAGLSDSLAALVVDEPRRRAMGEAGHHRATTEFTFDRFSRRLCDLIGLAERDQQKPIH
jgi:phosphatidylinositol alpha-1,6-mannosyltransferase